MQSSSCYIEYSSHMYSSYHFFWNVNFLTDISDVEKSKIGLTFKIRKRRFYLPPSHTISLDGSLPSNIFLFQLCSDVFQQANDHMLRERCINISPSHLSSRTKLPHHTLPLALNLGNMLTHYGGFPSAVVISACNILMVNTAYMKRSFVKSKAKIF